jgi:uncharacterized protein CbrC (UPF0167 family)
MKFSRLLLIGTFTLPCIAANDNFSLLFYVPDAQKEASVDAKFHDAAGEIETRYRDDFEDSKHVCMDEGGEGWMYNVETGRCEDKPTFTGIARIEGIEQSETREMNITLSNHTLAVSLDLFATLRQRWS